MTQKSNTVLQRTKYIYNKGKYTKKMEKYNNNNMTKKCVKNNKTHQS